MWVQHWQEYTEQLRDRLVNNMSRIMKRPMFRKGGSANQGIMSGMQDREKFQAKGMSDATRQAIEERAKLYRAYAGDPIASALIEGGLRLVSEAPTSSTLRNIASIAREPVQRVLGQEQQIGMKAVGDVLAEEQAYKLAAMKAANQKMTLGGMEKDIRAFMRANPQASYRDAYNAVLTQRETSPAPSKQALYANYLDTYKDHPGRDNAAAVKAQYGFDVNIIPDTAYDYDNKTGSFTLKETYVGRPGKVYYDPVMDVFYKFQKQSDNTIQKVEVPAPTTE